MLPRKPSHRAGGAQRRADAQINRTRILTAARTLFAERGDEDAPSIDQIAGEAGVAKGTVFRHFANRDELIAALLLDLLQQLTDLAELASTRNAGWETIADFCTRAGELVIAERAATAASFAAISRAHPTLPELSHARRRLSEAIAMPLGAAQANGQVRADVTASDLQGLVFAATAVPRPLNAQFPDLWRRYLTVMLDGLRPERTTPMPTRPIPATEIRTALS